MKKIIVVFILLSINIFCIENKDEKKNSILSSLVPKGYSLVNKAWGDLNDDKKEDLAILLEKDKRDENDDSIDSDNYTNPYILEIYLQNNNNQFIKKKSYSSLIDDYIIDTSLNIKLKKLSIEGYGIEMGRIDREYSCNIIYDKGKFKFANASLTNTDKTTIHSMSINIDFIKNKGTEAYSYNEDKDRYKEDYKIKYKESTLEEKSIDELAFAYETKLLIKVRKPKNAMKDILPLKFDNIETLMSDYYTDYDIVAKKYGYLNNDNIIDIVFVIQEKNSLYYEDKTRTLGIYFGTKSNTFIKKLEKGNLIPLLNDLDEKYKFNNDNLELNKNIISLKFTSPKSKSVYKFRYQNNKFKCIGLDYNPDENSDEDYGSGFSYNGLTQEITELGSKKRKFNFIGLDDIYSLNHENAFFKGLSESDLDSDSSFE